jgi:hypothetical protein
MRLLVLRDDQLGLYAYKWWAFAQAEKLGVSEDITPEIDERLRLKLLSLDTDSEDHVGLAKALQLVAQGELARGGKMFRNHMQRQAATIAAFDEAKTGRRRQRANARKPRQDALGELITGIMQRKPEITVEGLLAAKAMA